MKITDIGPVLGRSTLRPRRLRTPTTAPSPGAARTCRSPSCRFRRAVTSALRMHGDTDQFIRLDRGRGRAQMGPAKDELTFEQDVTDGWCVIVPAGSWHNITNTGDEPMQVYTIYAPQHHKPGKVHQTQAIAAADTDDEPADWSVQPGKVETTRLTARSRGL